MNFTYSICLVKETSSKPVRSINLVAYRTIGSRFLFLCGSSDIKPGKTGKKSLATNVASGKEVFSTPTGNLSDSLF